jgi:Mg-chelatase subunit ChlI
MRPEGPYPILILRGASGAGTSTTARTLRSLLDPARTPLQTLPNTPNQLAQSASRQRIFACDDVNRIPPALVSSLAKIAAVVGCGRLHLQPARHGGKHAFKEHGSYT